VDLLLAVPVDLLLAVPVVLLLAVPVVLLLAALETTCLQEKKSSRRLVRHVPNMYLMSHLVMKQRSCHPFPIHVRRSLKL